MPIAEALAEKAAAAFKALAALIAAIVRMIFGGIKEAGGMLAGDARRLTRAAKSAGEATGRAAGRILEGPARALDLTAGAVGATLGALLPRAPVTPKAVADAAVAQDDGFVTDPLAAASPAAKAALFGAAMTGNVVQFAAEARARGDAPMTRHYDEDLPPHVSQWLDGLSARQLAQLGKMHTFAVAAHVEGRAVADGLPPMPQPTSDRAEMQKMLSEIRRNACADRAGVAGMATRGPRSALPTSDDEAYISSRHAFH